VPICGGNAEIDLLALVVGQFVDEAWGWQATHGNSCPRNFREGSDNYRYRKLSTRSEGRVPDVPRCEARDLHPGLAHEKETVAYLMPRQTHAIDYDPFNPPEDVWQDGWRVPAEDDPSF
jgi:hypothetical protein